MTAPPSMRESFETWLRIENIENKREPDFSTRTGPNGVELIYTNSHTQHAFMAWYAAWIRAYALGQQAGAASMAERAAKVADDLIPAGAMTLVAGEMTASEIRSVKAMLKHVVQTIRSLKP